MFGEEELGVECEPEVTDLGGPVDSRAVKALLQFFNRKF